MKKYTRFSEIPKFISDGTYRASYTLHHFVRFIQEEVETLDLQLDPDFQRGHVWTEEQQVAWLEYNLRGGRSGNVIYLNKPSWNAPVRHGAYDDYVCVDGLQRITACQRFANNEVRVFGSYFNEFEDSMRVLDYNLQVCVNDLKTKAEVLQWYIDMNSGGTPHSEAEIARVKHILEKEKTNNK